MNTNLDHTFSGSPARRVTSGGISDVKRRWSRHTSGVAFKRK